LHTKFRGVYPGAGKDPESPDINSEKVLFATKPESKSVQTIKIPGEKMVTMGMAEVAQTIGEDQFLAEIDRCFSCGSCFGCEQCYMYCTSGCFSKVESAGPGMYFTINLDNCKECGKCIEVCPCGFLEVS